MVVRGPARDRRRAARRPRSRPRRRAPPPRRRLRHRLQPPRARTAGPRGGGRPVGGRDRVLPRAGRARGARERSRAAVRRRHVRRRDVLRRPLPRVGERRRCGRPRARAGAAAGGRAARCACRRCAPCGGRTTPRCSRATATPAASCAALLAGAGLDVVRATYCNSILFPVLFGRRTLDRVLSREGSDVGFLPAPLEWAFGKALRAEAALVRRGAVVAGRRQRRRGREEARTSQGEGRPTS